MEGALLEKIDYWLAKHSAARNFFPPDEKLCALDALHREMNLWYVKPIYKNSGARNIAKRARKILYKLRDRALNSCGMNDAVARKWALNSTRGVSAFTSASSKVVGYYNVAAASDAELAVLPTEHMPPDARTGDDDLVGDAYTNKLLQESVGSVAKAMLDQGTFEQHLHTFLKKRCVQTILLRPLLWSLVLQRAQSQDPVAVVVVFARTLNLHCTTTWCCRFWTAAMLLALTDGSPLWARTLVVAIGAGCPLFPPKITEEAMAVTLRGYSSWAEDNLGDLRKRAGTGFKGKLRKLDVIEKRMYMWIYKNEHRVVAHPRTNALLESLNRLVEPGPTGTEPRVAEDATEVALGTSMNTAHVHDMTANGPEAPLTESQVVSRSQILNNPRDLHPEAEVVPGTSGQTMNAKEVADGRVSTEVPQTTTLHPAEALTFLPSGQVLELPVGSESADDKRETLTTPKKASEETLHKMEASRASAAKERAGDVERKTYRCIAKHQSHVEDSHETYKFPQGSYRLVDPDAAQAERDVAQKEFDSESPRKGIDCFLLQELVRLRRVSRSGALSLSAKFWSAAHIEQEMLRRAAHYWKASKETLIQWPFNQNMEYLPNGERINTTLAPFTHFGRRACVAIQLVYAARVLRTELDGAEWRHLVQDANSLRCMLCDLLEGDAALDSIMCGQGLHSEICKRVFRVDPATGSRKDAEAIANSALSRNYFTCPTQVLAALSPDCKFLERIAHGYLQQRAGTTLEQSLEAIDADECAQPLSVYICICESKAFSLTRTPLGFLHLDTHQRSPDNEVLYDSCISIAGPSACSMLKHLTAGSHPPYVKNSLCDVYLVHRAEPQTLPPSGQIRGIPVRPEPENDKRDMPTTKKKASQETLHRTRAPRASVAKVRYGETLGAAREASVPSQSDTMRALAPSREPRIYCEWGTGAGMDFGSQIAVESLDVYTCSIGPELEKLGEQSACCVHAAKRSIARWLGVLVSSGGAFCEPHTGGVDLLVAAALHDKHLAGTDVDIPEEQMRQGLEQFQSDGVKITASECATTLEGFKSMLSRNSPPFAAVFTVAPEAEEWKASGCNTFHMLCGRHRTCIIDTHRHHINGLRKGAIIVSLPTDIHRLTMWVYTKLLPMMTCSEARVDTVFVLPPTFDAAPTIPEQRPGKKLRTNLSGTHVGAVDIKQIGTICAIPCAATPDGLPASSPSHPASEIQLAPMPEDAATEAHDLRAIQDRKNLHVQDRNT